MVFAVSATGKKIVPDSREGIAGTLCSCEVSNSFSNATSNATTGPTVNNAFKRSN